VVQIDGRPESALESQIGEELGVAGDSGGQSTRGGKEENGADFLETQHESCFLGNRRARVFVAGHKRAVTKRQRKRNLFGCAFAFLGQNRIKIKTKHAPRLVGRRRDYIPLVLTITCSNSNLIGIKCR
jgi:hypothetical protein